MARIRTVNDWVHVAAGCFVLLSLLLGVEGSPLFVSKWFLLFTAFVGLNLLNYGLTGLCPLAWLLSRCGIPKG